MTPRESRLVTARPTQGLDERRRRARDVRAPRREAAARRRRRTACAASSPCGDLKLHKQKPHSSKGARGRLRVGAAMAAAGDSWSAPRRWSSRRIDVLLLGGRAAPTRSLVAGAVRRAAAAASSAFPLDRDNVATAAAARRLNWTSASHADQSRGRARAACRHSAGTGARVPQLQASRGLPRHRRRVLQIIADGGAQGRQGPLLRHRLRRLNRSCSAACSPARTRRPA